jgi:CHAT domain-containing protein
MIKAAIACQDAAMLVYTRESAPNDRAMAQSSKGNFLVILAELQTGGEQKETLGKAWQCFDDALAIYDSDTNPINWALTSLNKGNAFYRVARSLTFPEREELLRAALASYDAALTVQLKGVDPASWALVHNSKGGTLTALAESPLLSNTEQTTILYDAVSCYEAALSIYRRKDRPVDWAMIQNNRGVALRLIAEKSEGEPQLPLLRRAERCHNAVLTTITRETAPLLWAATQNNQCVTYLDMANVLSHSQREKKLQLAQNCADAALSIYKRELFPAEHLRTAQYIGMHLFIRGYWPQAIQYLSSAFEALDNLFKLEITIRGRQSTLTSGTAIPACLAFALLQSEESERVIQAAKILERSRARTSGEAILHQEMQLAIVEQQMPDLLNEFRMASQRLAMIALPKEDSLAAPFIEHNEPSSPHLAEEPDKPIQSREQASRTLFNAHLAEYEEAQEAHQAYDKIVTQINEHLPTFLQTSSGFDQALQEITPDERLVYVADTPLGAIALLAANSDEHHLTPETQYWVDPSLTSPVIEQLLTGKNEEMDTQGLLEAQYNSSRLVRDLKAVSERLGQDEGIFANLACYCRTHAIQQLVVIPCGLLSLFPLHLSLINNYGQKELLLDRILMSYAPSAYVWSVCRRRAKEPTTLANILLVSDPQPQHVQLRSLPGAREEAQAVTHIVDQTAHGQVHILAEENATRQQVLAWLNHGEADFSYAHFACHGIVEFVDPYTSGVILADGERLTTRDLLDPSVVEPTRLRLAVLSACQTGLPGTQLPDEVVGLASGWLQVGAVGVIASLWPVSDRQTVQLMKMFYMLHLIDHIPPIRALWLAQRWLRGLPTWRQDFVSAGALHTAQEPDSEEALFNKHEWDFAISKQPGKGEVVHEENGEMALEKVRETIKLTTMISADFKLLMTTEEFRFWDNVRHWAAFVFYGA